MAFDYTAVTAGIRAASTESFLTVIDGSILEGKLAAKSVMADQVSPFVVASDDEYVALMQATKIFLSNIK